MYSPQHAYICPVMEYTKFKLTSLFPITVFSCHGSKLALLITGIGL